MGLGGGGSVERLMVLARHPREVWTCERSLAYVVSVPDGHTLTLTLTLTAPLAGKQQWTSAS